MTAHTVPLHVSQPGLWNRGLSARNHANTSRYVAGLKRQLPTLIAHGAFFCGTPRSPQIQAACVKRGSSCGVVSIFICVVGHCTDLHNCNLGTEELQSGEQTCEEQGEAGTQYRPFLLTSSPGAHLCARISVYRALLSTAPSFKCCP